MCQDPNKGAADAARMRNARTMYEWGNKKASYHSKEATGKTFADAAVIGFSRTRGAGQENAMRMAGEGRIRKAALAAEYATQQRVDEGGGSRTAGRNQFLSLLAKNSMEGRLPYNHSLNLYLDLIEWDKLWMELARLQKSLVLLLHQ